MSYTPQVGDRIRRDWPNDHWVDVEYVGQRHLIGVNRDGAERVYLLANGEWFKVEPRPELPELPEVWLPIGRLPSGKLYCSPYSFRTPEQAMCGERIVAAVKCTPDPDSVVWADEVQS